ncbi:MAG: glycosyltransferase family 2 protein [Burkholderiales bacterium]|nr:glycosyltransferase family 2 protein [Burkholderiales bacterium]
MAPSVSIVICNYNYAGFLGEAIASALAQTVPCQVVVVDDGSTDDSRRLLADADPRVEVVLQANGGQLAAYNRGFAACTGDVVIFLDADDALEPQAAATVAPLFDEGVAKVHFRLRMVDADGRAIGGCVPHMLACGDVLAPLVRHGLLYASAPGSGNAYRRSVLARLFPLPVDLADRVGADFFTIYGAAAFGSVASCEAPLGHYRLHSQGTSSADAMVFGNAALGNNEATKVESRYVRLRAWVAQRTGGAVVYPLRLLDFSVQKSTFAMGVLAKPYLAAVIGSGDVLAQLLKSIWLRREYGAAKCVGLSLWALLVLLAPRALGHRLARHVCNPASRTSA